MHPFIAQRNGCAFAALLVLTACCRVLANSGGPANRAAPPVNVVTLVNTIKETIIQKCPEMKVCTDAYKVPTAEQIAVFLQAVDLVVLHGNVAGADELLNQYAYDVYTIRSSVTGDPLVVFRERAPGGGADVERGWGTYIFNRSPNPRQADIHVNHPLFDEHTEEIGADLFQDCRCRWLFVAGAHRHANSGEESDMARTTQSIFHQVYLHVAAAKVRTVSVHGFAAGNHSFPDGVDQVLSVGTVSKDKLPQGYNDAEKELRKRLEDAMFTAGLSHFTPGYNGLGATENPQGHHSNTDPQAGRWLSVETESIVRGDPALWGKMNDVLRQWIIDSPL